MKKIIAIIFILSAILLLVACNNQSADYSETEYYILMDEIEAKPIYADYNSERSIDFRLGEFEDGLSLDYAVPDSEQGQIVDYITIKDVVYSTSLTSLSLINMGLTNEDIVLLRYMTNLVHLDLGVRPCCGPEPCYPDCSIWLNQISNISPLSGLANLEVLYLNDLQIESITPLSGLTSLTWLRLDGNQIHDVSPLSGLTNIQTLGLWHNQIRDISPLGNLKNLTWLGLGNNQISDIAPLSSLVNLETLFLETNQISDVSPLSGLVSLEHIYLFDNLVDDWSPVSHVSYVWGRP